jgi:hypothetical protein
MTASNDHVTSINAAYLKTLVKYFLQPLLDEVNTLTGNGQYETLPGASFPVEVPGIDSTLSVPAGGSAFKPASDLINALGKVGGTVNSDLNWFAQALTDTIDEINTTVTSMQNTDDLNAEQAQTILTDFAGAISDVTSSPTSSSSGSGSGSGSGSNG